MFVSGSRPLIAVLEHTPKKCFWSIYSSILSIVGPVEKSLFFRGRFGSSKNRKNRALGAQESIFSLRLARKCETLWAEGPRAPRARYYKTIKTTGKGTGVRYLTRRGPMARRFFLIYLYFLYLYNFISFLPLLLLYILFLLFLSCCVPHILT